MSQTLNLSSTYFAHFLSHVNLTFGLGLDPIFYATTLFLGSLILPLPGGSEGAPGNGQMRDPGNKVVYALSPRRCINGHP